MDEISERSYRASVARSLIKCFATWSTMPPEVWAEEVYRLPNGGRFRWDYAPYSRAMFRSLFDPATIETIFEMYSRGLKSTVVLLAIGYLIDQAPRRILSLWPTNSQAEKWSKDNLCGELFNCTPCLNYLGNETGRRIASNTLLHKTFPGGLIDMFGANAPGDMRRAKGSFLYAEEIDAIGTEQTDEGDQLAIFWKRGDEYPDTIRVSASYPSVAGASRIDAKMKESDENKWYSACVLCGGEPFVMHRSMVKYDKGRAETAVMICPRCKENLNDVQRYQMAHKQGFDNWKPSRAFRGKRGFHGNAMLWPHPVDAVKYPGGFLQMLAQQEIDADNSDNPARSRRVLINTVDAECFQPLDESELPPDHQPILDGREDYAPALGETVVPKDALVLTSMTDLHGDRLEVEWRAWSRLEESWGVGHFVLFGDTTKPEVWDEWTQHLQRGFPHALGGTMRLSLGLVDGGWRVDPVLATLARLRAVNVPGVTGRIIISKGVPQWQAVVYRNWATIKDHAKGIHIGTWCAKSIIYERLRWHSATEKPSAGFIHFGKCYSDEFIRQAVSEKSVKQIIKAREVETFKNPEGNRNEAIDLLVGNLAAFRRRKWDFDTLEAELTVTPDKPKEIVKPKSRMRPGAGPFNVGSQALSGRNDD